ncbi:winged helix-turn-helix domain-containing protein [Candidatus Saganbacteria bacterium]|nr:winged helix-turn-helix domain-containing protein [Candidatus Saganbacteria bacterium]
MQERIGEAAGKVWKTLGQKGEVSLAMLPKLMTEEKPEVVFQALGWLAHEGKINYVNKANRSYVTLNSHEKDIFKTIH